MLFLQVDQYFYSVVSFLYFAADFITKAVRTTGTYKTSSSFPFCPFSVYLVPSIICRCVGSSCKSWPDLGYGQF